MSVSYYNFGGVLGWTLQKWFPNFCSEAYLKLLFLTRKESQKKYIEYFMNKEIPPYPIYICLETVNRCNSDCCFCSANKYFEKRPYKVMSEKLFISIIDQLADWGYNGHLTLYGNNEPFLDTRLVERYKYCREKLPNSYIYLSTNGILLDVNIVKAIIPYVNQLIINNYCSDMKLHDNISEIYDYAKCHPNEFKDVELLVQMRYKGAVLTNRAGSSPNKKCGNKVINEVCLMPYTDMTIFPDGKVGICCCDNLEVTNLADLTKVSIIEAWNSSEYKRLRRVMRNTRSNNSFCKHCDFIDAGFRTDVAVDIMANRNTNYGTYQSLFKKKNK